MANNPNNNNLVSDSLSDESLGNYYTNQLSNEDVSSLVESADNSNGFKESGDNSNNVEFENGISDQSVSNADAGSDINGNPSSDDINGNPSSEGINGNSGSGDISGNPSSEEINGNPSSSPEVMGDSSSSNSTNSAAANSGTASSAGSGTVNDASSSSKSASSMKFSSTKLYAKDYLTVTLKDSNGQALSGKKVVFKIKNKSYTRTTDSNGQAKVAVPTAGSYKVSAKFEGDDSHSSASLSATVKVKKSSTKLSVLKTSIPRTSCVRVVLKNRNGNPISGKKVLFKNLKNNKTYKVMTNSKGQALFGVNAKKMRLRISFAGDSSFGKSKTKATVKTFKCKTKFTYSLSNKKYGEDFVFTLRRSTNSPIKDKKVTIKLSNKKKSYVLRTNEMGQVTIPMNSLGTLKMKVSFAGKKGYYYKTSASAVVNVSKGTTSLEDSGDEVGQGLYYYISLKNSAGKALANKKVTVTINKETLSRKTNSNGQIRLAMNYDKGSYPIVASYSGDKYYESSKLSKTLKVRDPSYSIPKIVAAAQDLKKRVDYISILTNDYRVTIDEKEYTMDEFAYLMAGAISHIKSGSKANVKIKDLSNNFKSSGANINGQLSQSEYVKLANEITSYVNSKKKIPNYKSTKLGKMEAYLYIYTFANVLDSYGRNNKLPSSIKVKTSYVRGGYSTSISQSGKILNYRQIYNSADFAKYLKTGGKSALNDAIKKKAKELTKGLKTPMAKSIAIFRFVRDDIGYSFYTNSRKGAKGTFSSKSGNCCDKANLIVAMCRSVGVYARYSHAQGCKFKSGLYTGHVWAQVYDTYTQTWYTADATSFRNEVGNIKNWNTKSHYRDKNYVLIPF